MICKYWCHLCGGHVSLEVHLYCVKHKIEDTCWDCQKDIKLVSKEVKDK